MNYDQYCAEHCPGGPPTDQPCAGTGHARSSKCESCVRQALAGAERDERRVFVTIGERRNDPEFMARLQRHVNENRVVLDRLADH